MAKETKADKAIRDAADEIRRETSAAAAEVRFELGAAKRETGEALREVMTELRSALSTIWEPEEPAAAKAGAGGRMSRAQRKEMTRELLLDAAIEVFAEKGYHGASLDDVADAAGFTKGAVYSNFTGKAELFVTLWTSRFDSEIAAALEQAAPVSAGASPQDVANQIARSLRAARAEQISHDRQQHGGRSSDERGYWHGLDPLDDGGCRRRARRLGFR